MTSTASRAGTSASTDATSRTRRLGATDVWLPAIGQGTTQTGGWAEVDEARDRRRIEVLRLGIDLGMPLVDTAELYGGGHAETLAGRALAGRRDRVFLASKFTPAHSRRAALVAACEGSLRRLATDRIDLYQMHWPAPDVPLDETLEALATLVRDGKVRHVGLGNVTVAQLAAARALFPGIVAVQAEYSLVQRAIETELLPYCQREAITVLAYSVLDRGAALPEGPRRRVLEAIARRHGRTPAQVKVRWALSRPGLIALVKSADPARTAENAGALGFELDAEDVAQLDRTFAPMLVRVPAVRVRLPGGAYATVDEALANPRDLVPAPAAVADMVAAGHVLRPLGVVPRVGAGDDADFDLADNALLYWGWVIARGPHAPMAAVVKHPSPAAEEGSA